MTDYRSTGGTDGDLNYLLHPLLVVGRLPLQLITALPGLLQLRLVQVATATGGRQVLLQLSDGHAHFLQLGMVLLQRERGDTSRRNGLRMAKKEKRSGDWMRRRDDKQSSRGGITEETREKERA